MTTRETLLEAMREALVPVMAQAMRDYAARMGIVRSWDDYARAALHNLARIMGGTLLLTSGFLVWAGLVWSIGA